MKQVRVGLFHLFGSTSEQRQSARSVAKATYGDIEDFFTKKIHVDYTATENGFDFITGKSKPVFTAHSVSFKTNGHIEYHGSSNNHRKVHSFTTLSGGLTVASFALKRTIQPQILLQVLQEQRI